MGYQKVKPEDALPETALSQAAFEALNDDSPSVEFESSVGTDSATLIREGAAAVRTMRSSQRSIAAKLGPLAR